MGCPINTGKQSLLVDIKHSTSGKEILKRLIQWADIVIVNQTSAQLRSLGCDELSMKQINPNVILTHFDAFGGPHHGACIIQHPTYYCPLLIGYTLIIHPYTCLQCFRSLSGPRSDAVGYDDLVQAATGIMVRMVVHVGGVTFSALDEHTCPDHFRAVVH